MEISDSGNIQCMKCRKYVFSVKAKRESKATCEACLHAESTRVTAFQIDNEALGRELTAIETAFAHELGDYASFGDQDMSLEEME